MIICRETNNSKLIWLRYLPELASQDSNGEITLKGEGRPDGIFSAKVYLSDDKFGQDVQNHFIQQLFQVQTAGIWTTSTNPAVKMRGYLEVRANLPAKVTRPDNWGSEEESNMSQLNWSKKKVNGNEFMGSWPAIWLLGYQPPTWPACGELDMVEIVNGRPSVEFNQSDHTMYEW